MGTDSKVSQAKVQLCFLMLTHVAGKNYTVLDGDIIFFKFNAGAGLTAKKK